MTKVSLNRAGLVLLVMTASCSFRVGSDANPPPQQRAAAPHPPPPAPAPAPPPPAGHPAAAPAPHAAAPAPHTATPVPVQQHTAVVPVATRTLNVHVAQSLRARNPKSCGYMEVSPGNWVHIDCQKYRPSAHSIGHWSGRKGRLGKQHKIAFKPLRLLHMHRALPGQPATGVGAVTGPVGPDGKPQTAEAFPSTIDHRAENLESPVKNQGGVGSCTAHSLSATLDNAAIRAGVLKPGDRDAMTSPLHVWSRYGLPDMGAAADGNIAQPVAKYSLWQQNDAEACELMNDDGGYAAECGQTYGVKPGSWRTDSGLMAKYNASQAAGMYKIAYIEKLEVSPPNMEEMIGVLATGADIWAAMLVDGYAWSNGKMKNAVIPDWSDYSGGHAIVISGYRETPSGKQFMIHNSWGDSWGDHGFAWVSEAMITKWLHYAYKVKITNGVKKEDLTDDDCAPDELVDLGTGYCAVMCGDEHNPLRPNNGCKK